MQQLSEAIEGRIVLITEGASGIGFATAKVVAAAGGKVVIADRRDDETLRAAAAEIGHSCTFHACDVFSWTQQVV